jgi:hypothetical protein
MAFTPEVKQQIMNALKEHGVKGSCPRCGTDSWALVDGYVYHPVGDDAGRLVIGGRTLPTISLLCANCGYLSEHSPVVLGLQAPFADDSDEEVRQQSSSEVGGSAAKK